MIPKEGAPLCATWSHTGPTRRIRRMLLFMRLLMEPEVIASRHQHGWGRRRQCAAAWLPYVAEVVRNILHLPVGGGYARLILDGSGRRADHAVNVCGRDQGGAVTWPEEIPSRGRT